MTTATISATDRKYQWTLVGVLSLNFGIVFFDRNSINVLMPFIQPELGLSNTSIGTLASALSLSWSIAGLFVGKLSDALGRRKALLVASAFLFSGATLLSGIAGSFAMLLAARFIMGIAEGGVMPISQVLVAAEVEPRRRGLAMGIAQNVGANLLGNFLAPVLLVAFAASFGWRKTFYLSALPGFVAALLMLWLIREPSVAHVDAHAPRAAKPAFFSSLRQRNVWLCCVLSILLVAFLVVFAAFMPLYLIKVQKLDNTTMSWLMSMWGLPSILYAFLVTGASDLFGRRPIVIAMGAASACIPIGILLVHGAVWPLFLMFSLGAAVSGIFPIVMAAIPSESVAATQLATVMGFTMGLGEVVGGVFSPSLAGVAADAFGLRAIIWILLGISVAITAFACGLTETAPAALARRQKT
jgi:ACS family hexuronate transporter-like MFS transporter